MLHSQKSRARANFFACKPLHRQSPSSVTMFDESAERKAPQGRSDLGLVSQAQNTSHSLW
jgi:hypothetical protein